MIYLCGARTPHKSVHTNFAGIRLRYYRWFGCSFFVLGGGLGCPGGGIGGGSVGGNSSGIFLDYCNLDGGLGGGFRWGNDGNGGRSVVAGFLVRQFG